MFLIRPLVSGRLLVVKRLEGSEVTCRFSTVEGAKVVGIPYPHLVQGSAVCVSVKNQSVASQVMEATRNFKATVVKKDVSGEK